MQPFIPVQPPKNPDECDTWLHEAIKRLNRAVSTSVTSVNAVGRGESPDGSGAPLFDTTKFFYKPGITGGQVAFGDTLASGRLVLSSTASAAKGMIYLGSSLASAFDEANNRLGISSASPGAKLEIKQPGSASPYSRPTSPPVPAGSWGVIGPNHAAAIAEVVADEDTTYIQSGYGTDLDEAVTLAEFVSLASLPDDQFVVYVQARKTLSSGYVNGIEVRVYTGNSQALGSVITLFTIPQASLTTSYQTFSYALTAAEGATFKAAGSHSLWFRAGAGNGVNCVYNVTQAYMQAPGGATPVDLIDLYDTNAALVSGFTSAGALFFKTGAAAGYIMRSDANGVSSWVSPATLATRTLYRWAANGPYVVDTTVDGAWVAPTAFTVRAVWLYRTTPGSSSSTILDLNLNGTTMYTTQANRPTIAFNDGDNKVQATLPDVTSVSAGDVLTIDIDQIEGGSPGNIILVIEGA